MLVILATNHLGLGGSESYLLTVGEQIDRLGHEPLLYTREPGGGAAVARERGMTVVEEAGLPATCDAIVVQDVGVSYELAGRFPRARQVFVAHSETFDLQSPPRIAGAVDVVVALNDRVLERLRAMPLDAELVRLRQPIDIDRFAPKGPLPERARRLLLLSNNLVADRIAMIDAACREAGLELTRVGGTAAEAQTGDTRTALAEAEIVVGYGRSLLEAMACGRAAYVYDHHGGDGWVTADSYPKLESDGFAGRGEEVTVDAARLRADLRSYSASMGPVNYDLVVSHHRANVHAQELVQLLRAVRPVDDPPNAPLAEMARLVRLEWRARVEAQARAIESARLNEKRHEAELGMEAAVETAIRNTKRHYETSLSWRLTRPVRAVTRLVRRRRGPAR